MWRWLIRRLPFTISSLLLNWKYRTLERIYVLRYTITAQRGLPRVVGVKETPWLCGHVRVVDTLCGRELLNVTRVDQATGMVERFITDEAGEIVVENDQAVRETVAVPCRVEWVNVPR